MSVQSSINLNPTVSLSPPIIMSQSLSNRNVLYTNEAQIQDALNALLPLGCPVLGIIICIHCLMITSPT